MSDSCECGYQYQPPHKESDAARHQAHCVLNFSKSLAKPSEDGYPPIQNAAVPSWVAAWNDVGRLHWKLGKPPDRQLAGTPCWPHYMAGYFKESLSGTCRNVDGSIITASSIVTIKTLRDEFAGMALQGNLAGNRPPMSYSDTARKAYKFADAMLVERKEGAV